MSPAPRWLQCESFGAFWNNAELTAFPGCTSTCCVYAGTYLGTPPSRPPRPPPGSAFEVDRQQQRAEDPYYALDYTADRYGLVCLSPTVMSWSRS